LTNVQRPDLVNYGTSYNDTQALEVIRSTSPVDSGTTITAITQLDGAGRPKNHCSLSEPLRPAWPLGQATLRAQITHELLVPAAEIVAQPLLNRALFLFGSSA
jgi:hypothetical protein